MPDNKAMRDGADRARVAASETYEVAYFAEKYGISQDEARLLIEQHGNSREVLDKAAAELKGGKR